MGMESTRKEVFSLHKEALAELQACTPDERARRAAAWQGAGVILPFPDSVFLGKQITLAPGCVILGGCILTGNTSIAAGCVIGPNTVLHNVTVGEGTELNNVVGADSTVGNGCAIGPFVQIRPNCRIGDKVHLGNFVEVKNSTIDQSTKVSHLTYVGDSDVGRDCNFGCGTVTVNYTGKAKFRTTIGDHVFIGCNTNLIAPVTLGDFAYTAAGSTITEDIPANALGIARARQVNKDDWVLKKKPYKE